MQRKVDLGPAGFDHGAVVAGVNPSRSFAAIRVAMQHYADRLTHYCRSAPYNWFNFFDFWQKK